jgi:glyoxylase-like metal-dependent hydrolase (beta-lactamase superfamily II)
MGTCICVTCGNHFSDPGPEICTVCADERQWVPPGGQRWTTLDELAAAGHRSDIRAVEPGLTGIGAGPPVAIGQRSLLVSTSEGNLLWDPSGFIDDAAVAAVRSAGGLRFVTASHPHFYGSISSWARSFGAEILVPADDVAWLRADADLPVRLWSGVLEVLPGVTLVQCGGHFPGSAVLHWAAGAGGRGVLLSGDTIFVTPGEDRVTFVWSAPNRLPLSEAAVLGVVSAVEPYRFDRIYGGWWTPVLRSGAWETVRRSALRYIEHLEGLALAAGRAAVAGGAAGVRRRRYAGESNRWLWQPDGSIRQQAVTIGWRGRRGRRGGRGGRGLGLG